VVGSDDIYLHAQPHEDNKPNLNFISSFSSFSLGAVSFDTFCHHITQLQSEVQCE
jgi:hypothetical protein